MCATLRDTLLGTIKLRKSVSEELVDCAARMQSPQPLEQPPKQSMQHLPCRVINTLVADMRNVLAQNARARLLHDETKLADAHRNVFTHQGLSRHEDSLSVQILALCHIPGKFVGQMLPAAHKPGRHVWQLAATRVMWARQCHGRMEKAGRGDGESC